MRRRTLALLAALVFLFGLCSVAWQPVMVMVVCYVGCHAGVEGTPTPQIWQWRHADGRFNPLPFPPFYDGD